MKMQTFLRDVVPRDENRKLSALMQPSLLSTNCFR